MIVHREFEQGSLDWLKARAGIPTASEFGNIMTAKFEPRNGEMLKSYVATKLAEAWLGMPLGDINTFAMEQGRILQDEAIPWLSLELNSEIEQVGLITDDTGRIGCSPDGIAGEIGVEVKAPQPTAHVKYLLSGKVPNDYLPQVYGGLYVTGFSQWIFCSYRRHFPNLVLRVDRDDKIQAKIGEALAEFLDRFDLGMKRLIDLNGGPPPPRPALTPLTPQPQPEPDDVPV